MRKNSIDYLFQQLWDTPKDKLTWYAILEEVKKMHKQEIIDAYQTSHISMMTAEQHYREAFED